MFLLLTFLLYKILPENPAYCTTKERKDAAIGMTLKKRKYNIFTKFAGR